MVYVGTSVHLAGADSTMLGGTDLTHLYHNSTLALDGDTGEIVWHYQHMNDHWDLDHPVRAPPGRHRPCGPTRPR